MNSETTRCLNGINMSDSDRNAHETGDLFDLLLSEYTTLKKKFEVEKRAKNTAYEFVLSRGHYDEWVEFFYSRSGDAHKNCIDLISKTIKS